MKSSLPTAGRHDESITQWDDYRSDLPAGQAGIPSRFLRHGTSYDR